MINKHANIFLITLIINFSNIFGQTQIIENWLSKNVQVAQSITWYDKQKQRTVSYPSWPILWKNELQKLYADILIGQYPTFPDPLPNLATDTSFARGWPIPTTLTDEDARHVYLSFLATSLFSEIQKKYGWSILNYSKTELDFLYNWDVYFNYVSNNPTGGDKHFIIDIESTPAPPSYLQTKFLDTFNIIQPTAFETISRLITYIRDNFSHFGSGANEYWQYIGGPPMSRVIEGTKTLTTGIFDHWTAGCHGTVAFSTWVGFMINIPIPYKGSASFGHRIFTFPSLDSLFLSHGDDPYGKPIEGRHFLTNKVHFKDFYTGGIGVGIGRRPMEIDLNIPSERSLYAYCNDFSENGLLREKNYYANNYSTLMATFSANFLNSIHFWDRIHLILKNNPQKFKCFSKFVESIEYIPIPIAWNVISGKTNPDGSIYKMQNTQDIKAKSNTVLSSNDWVEMVLYNSIPQVWVGIGTGPDIAADKMDFSLQIKDNKIQVFKKGIALAILKDEIKTSVKWLKISRKNGTIDFLVNGLVQHSEKDVKTSTLYNIYLSAEGPLAEINNIYSSSKIGQTVNIPNKEHTEHNEYNHAISLYLKGISESKDLEFQVKDIRGQIILNKNFNKSLSIQSLSGGIYFLFVKNLANGNVQIHKFVIK